MAAKTEDIDTKLVAALEALRNDRSIPATREKLAELAGCSSGAIRYRTKAVEALRAIKTARKATKAKPPKSVEQELRAEVADLKKQVKQARDQTQVQVNKRKDAERKLEKFQKLYAQLATQLDEAKSKLVALGANPGTVLPFRPSDADG